MFDVREQIDKVVDKESFLSFLGKLIVDYRENYQEWENKTIVTYIEAMMSWIEDASSSEFNDIDWNKINYATMAKILYMGKIYE